MKDPKWIVVYSQACGRAGSLLYSDDTLAELRRQFCSLEKREDTALLLFVIAPR